MSIFISRSNHVSQGCDTLLMFNKMYRKILNILHGYADEHNIVLDFMSKRRGGGEEVGW